MTEPEDPFYRLQPGETLHTIRGYHLDYILLYTPIIHEFVCKKAGICIPDACIIDLNNEGFAFCVVGRNRSFKLIHLFVQFYRDKSYVNIDITSREDTDRPFYNPFILNMLLDPQREQSLLKEIEFILEYEKSYRYKKTK